MHETSRGSHLGRNGLARKALGSGTFRRRFIALNGYLLACDGTLAGGSIRDDRFEEIAKSLEGEGS
ncbi:hypothetical protein GCM10009837_70400 [Streptomyces durmitorensis]